MAKVLLSGLTLQLLEIRRERGFQRESVQVTFGRESFREERASNAIASIESILGAGVATASRQIKKPNLVRGP